MQVLDNNLIRLVIVIAMVIGLSKFLFHFKPRRSEKIYSFVLAHRGLHLFSPENTLPAFEAARDSNMAIELDIRQTKDHEIVCFHDRYTKRLLNIPGKLAMFDLKTIKRYKVLDSDEYVPTLKEALTVIGSSVGVLIEVKGNLDELYFQRLMEIYNDHES